MKKGVVLTFVIAIVLIFGVLGLVYADSSCDQECSDAESAAQQASSDAESAQQQAESDAESTTQQASSDAESTSQQSSSDAESAQQQAESNAESAAQQAESDFESFLQQASSDFKSKVEENKERKISLEIVSELDENDQIKQKIKFRGIGVDTDLEVEVLEEGKARIRLSDGNYQDINVMPNTAFKIAVENLRSSNVNIRIEEYGDEELAAIYVADADKTIKVLGIFETKHNLEVEIDIEDGKIKVEDKPWWWFLVEEVEEEIDEIELQLIKPIQDIILIKNEDTMLNLDEYFLNAEYYSVSNPEYIFAEINDNLLTITPEVNWTGITSMTITAFKGEESLKSLFNIIVSEDNLSIQTLQYGAILNEPVKWKKDVKIEGEKRITLRLPKNSENVIIKTETGIGKILSQKETEDDLEIEIEEDENYEVEYYTEAPYAVEKDISQGKKEITIIGSEEVHYTDVLAYKQLPTEVPRDAVRLYLVAETEKKEIPVEKFDLNNNGLVDYIEWVVPTLSNETYELELNILNIQSYPTVGGNWEVRFNTVGTANLIISAINDTTYGNSVPDDLTPLELRCGETILNYDWQGNSIFYPDWNCDNQTAYWIVKVLTSGVHAQEFNFGGLIGYAYNFASENISFVPPTPANNSVQNTNSVYVNITSTEALSSALLNWGNSSGYTNVTMSGSGTNWYKNMTSLADGDYNFSVWAQNISGTWVQTEVRILSIDATAPIISIDYPANTSYSSDVDSLNYTFTELNSDKCWYSTDRGTTNSSTVVCGTNFTGLTSTEESNTWTVYINDTAGNEGPSSITFFKDTIYPLIDYGTGTAGNNDIVSQNYIYVNISVTEGNEDTITFLLHNLTEQVNLSSYTDLTREINWTGLPNGVYTYNVTINDTLGNVNTTSTRTITLDTSAPVISFSCDKISVYVGEVITCSCSATSVTDPDPVVTYTQNPSTSNTGLFTTSCSALDNAGASSSSSISYNVGSMQGGGYPNYKISSEDLAKGYTKTMRKNWKVNFKINKETHTLLVKDIEENGVILVLSSDSQKASLLINEEKKFELTGDNYYDISIRLDSIKELASFSTVDLTIKSINEVILNDAVDEEIEIKEKPNLTWLWVVLGIFILVLIRVGYDKYGKRRK